MKRFICILIVFFTVFCLSAEPRLIVSDNDWDFLYNKDTKSAYQARYSKLPYDVLKEIVSNYFGITASIYDNEGDSIEDSIAFHDLAEDIKQILDKGYNVLIAGRDVRGSRVSFAIITDGKKYCTFLDGSRY